MSHVFISYSSKDKSRVDPIYEGLKAKGVPVWMAPQDVPRNTRSWPAEITGAIRTSKTFLLFLTKHSNTSDDVEGEVNLARSIGKEIITVKLDDVEMSDALMYLLSNRQFIMGTRLNTSQIVEKVVAVLRGESPSYVGTTPTRSRLPGKGVVIPILLGLVGMIIIGLGFSQGWFKGTEMPEESLVALNDSTAVQDSTLLEEAIRSQLEEVPPQRNPVSNPPDDDSGDNSTQTTQDEGETLIEEQPITAEVTPAPKSCFELLRPECTNSIGMEFILIRPQPFTMGSNDGMRMKSHPILLSSRLPIT